MRVGIPKEIKPHEGRIALTPDACKTLVDDGHEVFVEKDGGRASGYQDQSYVTAGAEMIDTAAGLYATAELIVKVKEPVEQELGYLRPQHQLFSFLHLAANPGLAEHLRQLGLTALAFETLVDQGGYPILAPMSVIAGKVAIQMACHFLHASQGGSGLLLGGVAGTEAGHVLVLGAGQAGSAAALLASQMGAEVSVMDANPEKLDALKQTIPAMHCLTGTGEEFSAAVARADILVGAIMVAGSRAPVVVTENDVAGMRAGSVVVDIAIDQGGCIATSRPTNYDDPVYRWHDVQHCCVTNLPGAVPVTATQALSAEILPWLRLLLAGQAESSAALISALNISAGEYQHEALIAQYVG